MPRDGSGIYVQPFPDVAPSTTIASTVYNGFTHDVAQDLNAPRPVIAGGTGANNTADAMNNLGGELAKVAVTNYDSHPFQSGSFYSAASATGAPVAGHAFTGICYVAVVSGVATTDMFLEASDRDDTGQPGAKWIRQKKANVWSGWQKAAGVASGVTPPVSVPDNSLWWDPTRGKLFVRYNDGNSAQWVEAVAVPDIDPNTFVEISGDSMTGPLTLSGAPTVPLHASTKAYVDAVATTTTTAAAAAAVSRISGQCVMLLSGGNLLLRPKNGNLLTVNGVGCTVPAAGLTLAPTGLTAGVLYYIYAVAAAGAVTAIEASTTGHVTDASTGVEIKSGDGSRSLVGMTYVGTGPIFRDATNVRLVRSWYNRVRMPIQSVLLGSNIALSAGFTAASTTLASFVAWADDAVDIHLNFFYFSSVANTVSTSLLINGNLVTGANASIINTDASSRVLPGVASASIVVAEAVGAVEGFNNLGFGGIGTANISYYVQSNLTATVG